MFGKDVIQITDDVIMNRFKDLETDPGTDELLE
jgi:hypothetical protein